MSSVAIAPKPLYTQVTATAHGLTLPSEGVLPVVYDDGTSAYIEAQADAPANAADTLVVGIPNANTLRLQTTGPLLVPAHGLTVGVWYVLNPLTSGEVVPQDDLVPGDLIQKLFFVADSNQLILKVDAMDEELA